MPHYTAQKGAVVMCLCHITKLTKQGYKSLSVSTDTCTPKMFLAFLFLPIDPLKNNEWTAIRSLQRTFYCKETIPAGMWSTWCISKGCNLENNKAKWFILSLLRILTGLKHFPECFFSQIFPLLNRFLCRNPNSIHCLSIYNISSPEKHFC